MPDISADRLSDAHGVSAGDEVLGRAISLKSSLQIGLQIGHERLRLDANKNAAGAHIGNGGVNKPEFAAQAVELPGLHGCCPAFSAWTRATGFEIFNDEAVRMARGQVSSAGHGARSMNDFSANLFKP